MPNCSCRCSLPNRSAASPGLLVMSCGSSLS
ncbi:hypothetical protein H206_05394 [Candidatus Electrothrix aarhusensis]|uniref:Uncharacterized protein n=1 Tax=Candidatus Electrothrix aarhusensis TaxID=1859131 RepID=A0A3S3R1R9_9BACT|nr:hypothetical protein H206_05394 [Candidatus Electrothrix aarhusensis]